ncbi:hypothetical protein LSTR_LSTR011838 [Laodelphax striatellus]|uniref:RRM domain-containing protein n=1 Tax=Laodelphax striatellus TaxID=195883 RepID=A0A482X4P7_LAOST|nr:hypothetical protein LSTR_LSTR011838 [Laodelphax striatellus]
MGEIRNFIIGNANSGYSFSQLNGQIRFRRVDRRGEEIPAPDERGLEIIVKNIPFDGNADELIRLFLKAGVINEMRIMVNRDGFCKGIGFVKYESQFDCKLAMSMFNGYTFPGRKELIMEESEEFHEIEFSGIPSTVSMKCIETFFKSKYSDVGEVRQLSSRGGFIKVAVAFSSHRTAALARREFSRKKQIYWKSRITANWPETAKNYMRTAPRVSQAQTPKLYVTKWLGIEDSLLTKEFWIEHLVVNGNVLSHIGHTPDESD